jgi:Dna[CI] antecedent, DciA
MPDNFRKLGDVFKREPSFNHLREIVNSTDVIEEFLIIFPELKKIVEPKSLERKLLKLKVENPAWRSELRFKEKEIVEKINNFFNEERVKQIRFIG